MVNTRRFKGWKAKAAAGVLFLSVATAGYFAVQSSPSQQSASGTAILGGDQVVISVWNFQVAYNDLRVSFGDRPAAEKAWQTVLQRYAQLSSAGIEPLRLSEPKLHDQFVKLGMMMEDLSQEISSIGGEAEYTARFKATVERRAEFVNRMALETIRAASANSSKPAPSSSTAWLVLLGVGFLSAVGLGIAFAAKVRKLEATVTQQNVEIALGKDAVKQANDAIVLKSAFLATVSHELRTPLQTILGNVDILVSRLPQERNKRLIDDLAAALSLLEAQVKDMTDYERLEAGKLNLRPTVFNPTEVLNKLLGNLQAMATQRGIKLIPKTGNARVSIHADLYRFQQIATNLITNAIKYGDKGNVYVSLVFSPGDTGSPVMKLNVEDSGPGISAEHQKTLFEPFTQVDQSNTRRRDGAGLGLAIVKRLAELMGGIISVQSELGRGTRFEVRLPLDVVQESIENRAPVVPVNACAKRRILVVDDHEDVAATIAEMLEIMGHSPTIVTSGREALGKVAQRAYDAILLDIQMPEMDGFEVARRIRETGGPNTQTPIVAVTAFQNLKQNAAQAEHFSGHALKPIGREGLHAVLTTVFAHEVITPELE